MVYRGMPTMRQPTLGFHVQLVRYVHPIYLWCLLLVSMHYSCVNALQLIGHFLALETVPWLPPLKIQLILEMHKPRQSADEIPIALGTSIYTM